MELFAGLALLLFIVGFLNYGDRKAKEKNNDHP